MKRIKLSPRLKAVADHVPDGSDVADVGTDHGYIPVYLAQVGDHGRIIASDVRRGPLSSAMRTAEEYGVSERIEFVLADGLEGIDPGSVGCVVIAGMGGETIAGILKRAPWVRERHVRLVLQPQSKTAELTAFLDADGFSVDDARLVRDDGRIYLVMAAEAGRSGGAFTPGELYANRILFEKRDPLLRDYLDLLIRRFGRKLSGMNASGSADEDEKERTERILEDLRRMKEDTETWQL